MKSKRHSNANLSDSLFEEFSKTLEKKRFFCFQPNEDVHTKLQRIHNYCQKHGFILNHSTIDTIQRSLASIITSTFDNAIEENKTDKKQTDIRLQLTHVNALPSRNEQGIFIIIELGSLIEDTRFSLISLLGKQIPSYDILHSQGYNLTEEIRKSTGMILIDHLAIGLRDFLTQVRKKNKFISFFI